MGFKMEKISVIVPVYNVERYLRRCVDSIINQTYRNLQIILVDDGSKDSSGHICDEYASKDQRIIVIHKANGGLGSARNAGIEKVIGKYLTFVDGDDSIERNHIESLYMCLKERNADTCLGGHTKVYKTRKEEHINVCAGREYEGDEVKNNILVRMLGKLPNGSDYIEMSVCMVLFSTEIIKKYNLQFHSEREFISEDLIFDFDYYTLSSRTAVSKDVGYNYYDNEDSLTTKYYPERFNQQKIMTQEVIKRAKENGIYGIGEQRILNTFLAITRYCIKLEVKQHLNRKDILRKRIDKICLDPYVCQCMNHFDRKSVSAKSSMVNSMIFHHNTTALILIMWLKNTFNI